MLTYYLDDAGSKSLYQYLYECIRKDIISGSLSAGDRLPSKRSFAGNLGVSTITVENAYDRLIAEGYIYSIPKKGYYVSELEIPSYDTERYDSRPDHGSDKRSSGYRIDLVSNRISQELFPFSVWSRLTRQTLNDHRKELMEPSPPGGVYELRQAVAQHLFRFRGMEVSPDQVIIGSGTEYLYGLIIQLLGRDKTYALEDPGYQKIEKIYLAQGGKVRRIPLDAGGVNMRSLQSLGGDVLHISPSHHFPTGIVTPVSRRYELLGWLNEKDSRFIVEDDFDSELRLRGHMMPTLRSIDMTGRVIYMNTFSKTLTPTIRISYMVLSPELADRFERELGFYSCTVSVFEQYILAEFIRRNYFERHLNRARKFYRDQRERILSELKARPELAGARIMEEGAGLHFLLKLPELGISDRQLCDRAAKEGLRISCLSEYYARKQEAPVSVLVINYSSIDPDRIGESIDTLARFIDTQEKRHVEHINETVSEI